MNEIEKIIKALHWSYGRSYLTLPHEHIVFNKLPEEFLLCYEKLVQWIIDNPSGETGTFGKNTFIYCNIGKYKYWLFPIDIEMFLNKTPNPDQCHDFDTNPNPKEHTNPDHPFSHLPSIINRTLIDNDRLEKIKEYLQTHNEICFDKKMAPRGFSLESSLDCSESPVPAKSDSEQLYKDAVELVIRDNKPLISHIQRCLAVGYNTAAGLIEKMEAEGIVSTPDKNNTRKIL